MVDIEKIQILQKAIVEAMYSSGQVTDTLALSVLGRIVAAMIREGVKEEGNPYIPTAIATAKDFHDYIFKILMESAPRSELQ